MAELPSSLFGRPGRDVVPEPDYKKILFHLLYGLTLADHLGDVRDSMQSAIKATGLVVEEDSDDDEEYALRKAIFEIQMAPDYAGKFENYTDDNND